MTFTELLSQAKKQVESTQVAEVKVDKKGVAKVVFTPEQFKSSLEAIKDLSKTAATKKGEIYAAGCMAQIGGVPAPSAGATWKPEYFSKFTVVCEKLWSAEGKTGLEAGQAKKQAHTNATGLKRAWLKIAGIVDEHKKSPEEIAALKLLKAIRAGKKVDYAALTALVEATK
jgi:hypothetical protein